MVTNKDKSQKTQTKRVEYAELQSSGNNNKDYTNKRQEQYLRLPPTGCSWSPVQQEQVSKTQTKRAEYAELQTSGNNNKDYIKDDE